MLRFNAVSIRNNRSSGSISVLLISIFFVTASLIENGCVRQKTSEERVVELDVLLKKGSSQDHVKAIHELKELALKTKESIPVLVDALSHKEKFVVEIAIETLGKIGSTAFAAVPKLFELSIEENSNPGISFKASKALKEIVGRNRDVIIEYAKSSDYLEKKKALELIGDWRIAEGEPLLRSILFGDDIARDKGIRDIAYKSILEVKVDDFKTYTVFLDSDDKQKKWSAHGILVSYDAKIIPFLLKRLQQAENEDIIDMCIEDLSKVGNDSEEAVQAILAIMSDPRQNIELRHRAMRYVSGMKAAAAPLISLLKSKDKETFLLTMSALAVIAAQSENDNNTAVATQLIPHLERFLSSKDDDIRARAVEVISYLSPQYPALKKIASTDSNEEIRDIAIRALKSAHQ